MKLGSSGIVIDEESSELSLSLVGKDSYPTSCNFKALEYSYMSSLDFVTMLIIKSVPLPSSLSISIDPP